MAAKKFYWLKLKRDFFKRHDIRIIEAMPNGKDYILFYLKLLLESIDHEGELRFSDAIPYNDQMLSVITNTNIDIVRSAMKLFVELKLVEIKSDETIYMEEVSKMIGSETKWAEYKRKGVKAKVENLPQLTVCQRLSCELENFQRNSKTVPTEIEKEKEKEKETEQEEYIEEAAPPPPPPAKHTRHKYGEFGWVKLTDEEYQRLLRDMGEAELRRCITYVDESAQSSKNKNKWSDWNLVVRRCHRDGWGLSKKNKSSGNVFKDMLEEEMYG